MSVPIEAARAEDQPRFFTIQGLAASFGISPHAIRKYKEWGHVSPALSHRSDGFNYDITHYRQIAKVRQALLANKPLSHGRNRHAHVIVVARGKAPVAA